MQFDFQFRLNINEFHISLTPERFTIYKNNESVWGYSTLINFFLFKDYYDDHDFSYSASKPLFDYDSHYYWLRSAWRLDSKLDPYSPDFDPIPF